MLKKYLPLLLLGFAGCAHFSPASSLTLLSDKKRPEGLQLLTKEPVEQTECAHMALIFFGGSSITHEAAIDKLLDQYKADVLVDAELTASAYGFPYIYLQNCVHVKGIPAKRVDHLQAAAMLSPRASR